MALVHAKTGHIPKARMHSPSTSHRPDALPACAFDSAESRMLGCMRVILSLCVLLTVCIDPSQLSVSDRFSWFALYAYVVYSLYPLVLSTLNAQSGDGRLLYWIDVLWIGLVVYLTHGTSSIFLPVFFFSIAASSFRRGFDEGARITLASASLYIAGGLLSKGSPDLPRMLLRTAFVLTFGYMSAHWGETKVRSARRLALLRDVTRLPNPRFGTDQAIASLLEKTLAFFRADKCILISRETGSGHAILRVAEAGRRAQSIAAEVVTDDAIQPLAGLSREHIVLHNGPRRPAPVRAARTLACSLRRDAWHALHAEAGERIAAFLEAHSFISAPLTYCNADARIYIISARPAFGKTDAIFLSHVMDQAFPAIENIELVDRMASDAAARERQKIGLDIHDTAIQPYIGLKLGLHAMRNKAGTDNPLSRDLDKLIDLTSEVITDLRQYAGTFRNSVQRNDRTLLDQLRHKVAQVKAFYGIDIALNMDGSVRASDRLAAAVSQIVSEGLSNICKHTDAQRGTVHIALKDSKLLIRIENEDNRAHRTSFMPRSISERAAVLGGSTAVRQTADGLTSVEIGIPI